MRSEIATKRLRYRVELAADVGERRAQRVLPWLEKLQAAIGRWHDNQALREMTVEGRVSTEERRRRSDRAELKEALLLTGCDAARNELEEWVGEL